MTLQSLRLPEAQNTGYKMCFKCLTIARPKIGCEAASGSFPGSERSKSGQQGSIVIVSSTGSVGLHLVQKTDRLQGSHVMATLLCVCGRVVLLQGRSEYRTEPPRSDLLLLLKHNVP